MACWTASAKWAAGPALDGQHAMPLALRLSEGLGLAWVACLNWRFWRSRHAVLLAGKRLLGALGIALG